MLMNTRDKGEVSIVILRDPDRDEFVGFIYEFAIVKYGNDVLELKNDLVEAAKGYVEAVRKTEVSEKLFDRSDELPQDLQSVYRVITNKMYKENKPRIKTPKSFADALNVGDAFLVPACV